MKFEVWADDISIMLVRVDVRRNIDPGMVLVRTFEVDHWTEACILHNRANGWGWWIPMDEDREDYLRSLRKLGFTPQQVNDDRDRNGLPRLEWLHDLA
jgi:hypothetical protein